MLIRLEEPADTAAIHLVHYDAFRSVDEPKIVDALRASGAITLSLVVELNKSIVGSIVFSPVTVEAPDGTTHEGQALAPLAVMPAYQRRGLGAALIHAGLERLRDAGHPRVFLIGHPEYYPRFGFIPAYPLGFRCAWANDPGDNPHFMVCPLQPGALDGLSGYVRFRPEF